MLFKKIKIKKPKRLIASLNYISPHTIISNLSVIKQSGNIYIKQFELCEQPLCYATPQAITTHTQISHLTKRK